MWASPCVCVSPGRASPAKRGAVAVYKIDPTRDRASLRDRARPAALCEKRKKRAFESQLKVRFSKNMKTAAGGEISNPPRRQRQLHHSWALPAPAPSSRSPIVAAYVSAPRRRPLQPCVSLRPCPCCFLPFLPPSPSCPCGAALTTAGYQGPPKLGLHPDPGRAGDARRGDAPSSSAAS